MLNQRKGKKGGRGENKGGREEWKIRREVREGKEKDMKKKGVGSGWVGGGRGRGGGETRNKEYCK